MDPDRPAPSWDDVIASFTATADHAQALLGADPNAPVLPAPVVTYDVWRCELAPPSDETRVTLAALHERQRRLTEQLQDAMTAIRRQQSLLESQSPPRRAIFVDQRA